MPATFRRTVGRWGSMRRESGHRRATHAAGPNGSARRRTPGRGRRPLWRAPDVRTGLQYDRGLQLVAEAPVDLLQDPRRSIEEVNIAGLSLARLTVYEMPAADAVAWYQRVAALQREVSVVRAFAPLPRRLNRLAPTTGYDDVRRVALPRLLVENVPSSQVYW